MIKTVAMRHENLGHILPLKQNIKIKIVNIDLIILIDIDFEAYRVFPPKNHLFCKQQNTYYENGVLRMLIARMLVHSIDGAYAYIDYV